MIVTCNVLKCQYYNKGFCGKPLLNIIDGGCGVLTSRRQIYYDIFKPQFKNQINIIEPREEEIRDIKREEAAVQSGSIPAKPHEQEAKTKINEEESAIKENDKEDITKNNQ